MERVKTYVNCVSDANKKANSLYMALCDKYSQFEAEKIISESSIFQWIQTWGSTSCGFGGIGGAAMTSADCVVVEFDSRYSVNLGIACIYHHGRFAYSCIIDDTYIEMVKNRAMPGQASVKKPILVL